MELERDLVVFDLETTGLNIQTDQIIQIAAWKRNYVGRTSNFNKYIKPTIFISKAATEVHGITNDDARINNAPTFREARDDIYDFFFGCDIAGFNIFNFDLPLLVNEFERCGIDFPGWECSYVDVSNIFKRKEQRTLSAAVKYYLNRDHEDAHDAFNDTIATMEILEAQLKKYEDLPKSMKELAFFSNYDSEMLDFAGKFKMIDGKVCYNFGSQRGLPVEEDPGLAQWLLEKDFPSNTKKIARKILSEIYPDEEVFK